MRRSAALLVLTACCSAYLFPQTASPAGPAVSNFQVAVTASWIHPNLDPVFDAYSKFEQVFGLRPWKNDGVRAAIAVEGRYRTMSGQAAIVEASATGMYRKWGTDASMTGIYLVGAGYRVRLLDDPVALFAQATVGAVSVNFSRSYNDDNLEINDTKTGFYGSGGIVVGYPVYRSITVEASARYYLVPKLKLDALHAELKPGGPALGLGLAFAL